MGMPIYRPYMANDPAGTKLGAASHPQILSLEGVQVTAHGFRLQGQARKSSARVGNMEKISRSR